MEWKNFVLLLCFIPILHCEAVQSTGDIVQTTQGPVKGHKRLAYRRRYVDEYLGIPFAKAPLGNLRFRPPQKPDNWTDVLDADVMSPSCSQIVVHGWPDSDRFEPKTVTQEDCLYLNVWTPRRRKRCGSTSCSGKKRATIIWIYGGSFVRGSSSQDIYDGAILAASRKVNVVTFNYRLGPLGFLYTGNESAPGNVALMDQAAVMKWVYENIEAFGGDKDKITVVGQSAGAICAHLHLLLPESQPYINNVILQSSTGMARNFILTPQKALERTIAIANASDCLDTNDNVDMDCLLNTDSMVLMKNTFGIAPGNEPEMGPVIDGTYLTDAPWNLVTQGKMKKVNILLGVNKNEGTNFLPLVFPSVFIPPPETKPDISKEQFTRALETTFPPAASPIIIAQYATSPNPDYTDLLAQVIGDTMFKCPVLELAQAQSCSCGADVYVYSFEQQISNFPYPLWYGVMHGFEVEYVFGVPLADDGGFPRRDKRLSYKVMRFWTNFAKYGNPNGNPNRLWVSKWPRYTRASLQYITLNARYRSKIKSGLRQSQCTFWATLRQN